MELKIFPQIFITGRHDTGSRTAEEVRHAFGRNSRQIHRQLSNQNLPGHRQERRQLGTQSAQGL